MTDASPYLEFPYPLRITAPDCESEVMRWIKETFTDDRYVVVGYGFLIYFKHKEDAALTKLFWHS